MLNIVSPCVPDFDQYSENIGANGTFVYIDINKYMENLREFETALQGSERECTYWLRLSTLDRFREVKRDSMISALLDYCGLPEDLLTVRGKNGSRSISLDQTKVLIPLKEFLDSKVETDFSEMYYLASNLLDSYLVYKQNKTLFEQARAKLNMFQKTDMVGWAGQPLVKINFKYKMQDTGRFYAYDDNLQNWNLKFVSTIAAPKDYFLFWCDFNQIDFRVGYNIYLRETGSKEDQIYLGETDKYLAMYKIMCNALDIEPDVDLFKEYRPAYKKAVLSAMYNASEASLARDIKHRELAKSLKRYFLTNEKYNDYLKIMRRVIDFGVELPIRDYFGFERVVPIPGNVNTNDAAMSALIAKGCNTPVQATSNSIMVNWLNSLVQTMRDNGYSEEQFRPYLIRHDEGVFLCHKSVMQKSWILKNYMAIAIDDWDILTLEESLGLHYDIEDDILMDTYNTLVSKDGIKLSPRTSNAPRVDQYRPISDIVEVITYTMYEPKVILKTFIGEEGVEGLTDDEAVQVIQEIAKDPSSPYAKASENYLKYKDVWLIKSNKIGKYRFCDGLDMAFAALDKMKGTMLLISNCSQSGITLYGNVYVKMDSSAPFHVMRKLNEALALENKEGWFTLESAS